MDPAQLLNIIVNVTAMLVGIPGNALVVMVYANKQFRTSAHVLIMGLAVADLTVCLTRPLDIFFGTPKGLHFYSNYRFWCKGWTVISTVLSQWSVYIMALIAVDRYFAVCRPHDHAITPKRALVSTALCFVVAVAVDFPISIVSDNVDFYFFGIYLGKRCDPAAGPRWLYLLQKSLMYSLILISLAVMIVLYTKVVIEVRRRTTVRPVGDSGAASTTTVFTDAGSTVVGNLKNNPTNDHSSNENGVIANTDAAQSSRNPNGTESVGANTIGVATNREVTRGATARTSGRGKTTKMLLLTTLIFIITYLPTFGLSLVPDHILIANVFTQKKILLTTFFMVRNVYVLNHVINPILYGFINKRFREDCGRVVRRMKCNR